MRKKGNDVTVVMVILYNKIMQYYPKFYPQKGVRIIYIDSVVTENGEFPSMHVDIFHVGNMGSALVHHKATSNNA